MVSIAEITSIFKRVPNFCIHSEGLKYIFSYLSLLIVVPSEPSRDKTFLDFFFFLSRQLHGYNSELAYSIQILLIDLKQIKMQLIHLLMLPERLTLHIKEVHVIAKLWSKWTSCKWEFVRLFI